MIALISFEKRLAVPKEEATAMGLKFAKAARYGMRNDELEPMNDGYFYYDEVFKHEVDGKIEAYYEDETMAKKVDTWWLYKRPPEADYVTIERDNHLVNLEEFVTKCKQKFYIQQALPTTIGDPTSLMVAVNKVTEKFDEMLRAAQKLENQQFNERCHVHVGGGLITTYNELLLKEDVCTDVLQEELNKGWRIIAVCVQPDQRRPDYILGRYNADMDLHDNALR
jgi:hypothetical protein